MEETQEPPAMTVHFLADAGHGWLLQQALDQLLDHICPEVRLFQVSERVRPVKYYGKSHPRRCEFPGMSVWLFLDERLGQERLCQVLDSLQCAPWRSLPAQGRPCPYLPAKQETYSLDSQMPTWSVRQRRDGPEILRITLHCGFDNYEDAIRLYGMILQSEATVQKSSVCFFVLYATPSFTLQLSLKQLPPGTSVDPQESSVLQFRVQEIGQLVPLLPNPCAPISRTRWRTQDYDGRTVLLQVQLSPGPGVENGELPFLGALGSRLASGCAQRTMEWRTQRSRSRRFKVRSLEFPEPRGTADSSDGPSWRSPDLASQVSSSATSSWPHLPPHVLKPAWGTKDLKGDGFQKLEAETDVDTGFTIINPEPVVNSLSKDLEPRLPPSCPEEVTSLSKEATDVRVCPLSLAGPREFGARKIISTCSHRLPIQGEEKEEEEFFI
ncbi:protein FAM124B [Dipodomys spectabilis]|uniref:protein FAM124B n=1 Tax=Dipodomys spectabilis TaxID=105255 RepID=UPI001C535107|nr:protein FAM124B [Dipodomys spectabilis]